MYRTNVQHLRAREALSLEDEQSYVLSKHLQEQHVEISYT